MPRKNRFGLCNVTRCRGVFDSPKTARKGGRADVCVDPQSHARRSVPAADLRMRGTDESREPRAARHAPGPRAEDLQVHALWPATGLHGDEACDAEVGIGIW